MKTFKIFKKRDGQSFNYDSEIYASDFDEAKRIFAKNMTDDNWNISNDIVWLGEDDGVEETGWYNLGQSLVEYKDEDCEVIDSESSVLELFCSEAEILDGFDTWSEDVYSWELRDSKETQLELQKRISSTTNIGIVTCPTCTSVILHNLDDTLIVCPDCGEVSEPCDFPDLNF